MGYAKRTQHLAPEGAYQVLAKAGKLEAAGKEIIHFEIGQPDYRIAGHQPHRRPHPGRVGRAV